MKWFFIISFNSVVFIINGQKNQVDYLELLYDQGHYKMVYNKSKRLLKKDEISQNYSILFFNSLSEFMLSSNKNKFSIERSISNYKKVYVSEDNDHIRKIYHNYIHDFKNEFVVKVIDLKEIGKKKQGQKLITIYNELFINESIDYNDLKIIHPKEDPPETKKKPTATSSTLLEYAKNYLGVPYVYGGTTSKGFDCSGFTQHVYIHFGHQIPRTAQNQSQHLKKIKLKNVKTGDLLFYGKNKGKITHVGIAIKNKGEGLKMIHASSSKGISITSVDNNSYWEPKLQFAGKIID